MWTKEEQAEHRKLWVDALRSGEYTQCQRVLSNKIGYCCLGVACEVAAKNGLNILIEKDKVGDEGQIYNNIVYDGEQENLPSSVTDWLGFSDELNYDEDYLIDLNDSECKTFDEIANVIEFNKPLDKEEECYEDG